MRSHFVIFFQIYSQLKTNFTGFLISRILLTRSWGIILNQLLRLLLRKLIHCLPGQTISLIEIHREKLIIYHLSVHWICLLYLLYTSPDSQQNPKDQQCFWSWPGITISVTLSPPWRSFSILMTVHNLTRTPTGLKRNPRLKWKAYIRCHRKRWLQNRQFLVSSIKIKLTLIVILYLYKSQINFDRVQKIFT